MKLGKTLYVKNRVEWRRWLKKNHRKKSQIWLITYRKYTKKPSIPYNTAVEEALCFGWIDSIVKGLDKEKLAQRFSPRKSNANWSWMNKERMRRLIKEKRMTTAGLSVYEGNLNNAFRIPADILKDLKKDKTAWKNFNEFPESYKRIRIGWIEGARKRPDEFKKRLKYFLKMTAQYKMFGMVK